MIPCSVSYTHLDVYKRQEFALNHAIKGFGMDFEKALELLRNHNDGLTKLEKEQRNILVAAYIMQSRNY